MNNHSKILAEFPKGKESYCPQCYFDDDKTILREECPHRLESLEFQIDYLAKWILANCEGYPNRSEGAVATAVQIIEEQKKKLDSAYAEGKKDALKKVLEGVDILAVEFPVRESEEFDEGRRSMKREAREIIEKLIKE